MAKAQVSNQRSKAHLKRLKICLYRLNFCDESSRRPLSSTSKALSVYVDFRELANYVKTIQYVRPLKHSQP